MELVGTHIARGCAHVHMYHLLRDSSFEATTNPSWPGGDNGGSYDLWGEDVSLARQGEADPVIDIMNEFALSNLLKQGTRTWYGGGYSGDC